MNGVTGGASHNGILFQGFNSIANFTIDDATWSQAVLVGDAGGKHSTAFVQDKSTSAVSYQNLGTNSYAGINEGSTSPYGIYQTGTYSGAAYRFQDALIGKWGGASSYTALSLNQTLNQGSLNGFFGSVSDPNLYANTQGSYFWRVGNATIAQLNGQALALTSGLKVGLATQLSYAAPAIQANGTTQATATAITRDLNVVTGGTGGIILSGLLGQRQEVFNRVGAAFNVYPPSGAGIESGTANTAVSLASGGHAAFECLSATQCYQAP